MLRRFRRSSHFASLLVLACLAGPAAMALCGHTGEDHERDAVSGALACHGEAPAGSDCLAPCCEPAPEPIPVLPAPVGIDPPKRVVVAETEREAPEGGLRAHPAHPRTERMRVHLRLGRLLT
ncbi:MAG TPA: hypothetical protein EYQ24_06295 [Bacteroidetes bacterium]|nr:hypothetical protein [Bacteroidota bacterium]HIL56919.1 hypothetical protein [Rhodothermales bacterium]